MTEDRIREAGRRLVDAWLAAQPAQSYPDELRARSRCEAYAIQDAMAAEIDPRPVRPGSVVQARFGALGAIDIVFTD